MNQIDARRLILNPGEIAFERAPFVIQTLLGSCVALTAWNPKLKVGGMCHYLLCESSNSSPKSRFRFACFALPKLLLELNSFSSVEDFRFGLFGGGNMFSSESEFSIGEKNVNYAISWLEQQKIEISVSDIGDAFCRKLSLNLDSGEIELKRYEMESEKVYL